MDENVHVVTSGAELVEAVQAAGGVTIEVRGTIGSVPSLRLKAGQKISGTAGASLHFVSRVTPNSAGPLGPLPTRLRATLSALS